ncbi:hypothetical protein [Kitasatospora sp. MY 5-36]|uniref:hypothetical protein n=1 Tax=Kitasatospora sp. MY 5-36 TaxID=1678027 RepID=UPI00131D227F|nr:hypothetical protein [Kitasatospora sp. MY 5-36]
MPATPLSSSVAVRVTVPSALIQPLGLGCGLMAAAVIGAVVSSGFWSLAGWTVQPDVFLVLGEGHQVGWVERGLAGLGGPDQWVAVYERCFIGDQATQEAMLHDTAEQAARTVQLAYLHNI